MKQSIRETVRPKRADLKSQVGSFQMDNLRKEGASESN